MLISAALVAGLMVCTATERWQRYANAHLGLTLEYPENWKVESEGATASMVRFVPAPPDEASGAFAIGVAEPVRDSWFDDFGAWVRRFKKRIVASGGRILREERLPVNGREAVRLTYRSGIPGEASRIDVLVGVSIGPADGQVYRLTYKQAANERDRAAQEVLYRHILSSIEIKK